MIICRSLLAWTAPLEILNNFLVEIPVLNDLATTVLHKNRPVKLKILPAITRPPHGPRSRLSLSQVSVVSLQLSGKTGKYIPGVLYHSVFETQWLMLSPVWLLYLTTHDSDLISIEMVSYLTLQNKWIVNNSRTCGWRKIWQNYYYNVVVTAGSSWGTGGGTPATGYSTQHSVVNWDLGHLYKIITTCWGGTVGNYYYYRRLLELDQRLLKQEVTPPWLSNYQLLKMIDFSSWQGHHNSCHWKQLATSVET